MNTQQMATTLGSIITSLNIQQQGAGPLLTSVSFLLSLYFTIRFTETRSPPTHHSASKLAGCTSFCLPDPLGHSPSCSDLSLSTLHAGYFNGLSTALPCRQSGLLSSPSSTMTVISLTKVISSIQAIPWFKILGLTQGYSLVVRELRPMCSGLSGFDSKNPRRNVLAPSHMHAHTHILLELLIILEQSSHSYLNSKAS